MAALIDAARRRIASADFSNALRFEAGASLVHIHACHADESPGSGPEKFAQVQEGVREHCPGMIIQFPKAAAAANMRRVAQHQIAISLRVRGAFDRIL